MQRFSETPVMRTLPHTQHLSREATMQQLCGFGRELRTGSAEACLGVSDQVHQPMVAPLSMARLENQHAHITCKQTAEEILEYEAFTLQSPTRCLRMPHSVLLTWR